MAANNSALGTPEQLRDPNYTPPMAQAIPLGIQHVLAMFASNVTPAIIVAGAAGFGFGSNSPEFPNLIYMIQMSMLFAGIATLFQTIGFGPVGARLPIVQGTSFCISADHDSGGCRIGCCRSWRTDDRCFHWWPVSFLPWLLHRENPVCLAASGNGPDRPDDRTGADQGWH